MKVKELIEELQKYDGDKEVRIATYHENTEEPWKGMKETVNGVDTVIAAENYVTIESDLEVYP